MKKLESEAGRIMFPEILADLLLIRENNIHVEIADKIEVNILFHRRLLKITFVTQQYRNR